MFLDRIRVFSRILRATMTQNNVFYSTDSILPCKEFTIPVPWGHIAAKSWGDEGGRPVLGLHGFLDNSNTFLRLVSYLPTDIHFICIDWPGHGRSSHRPAGTLYYNADYVMDVKRTVDALGWKRFSIIGHSMGAGSAFMFASAFPDAVEKLVLIEGLAPIARSPETHGERFSKSFHQLIKTEAYKKEDERLYTKEELLERFKVGHEWCTEDSARLLMERAVSEVQTQEGTKYAFTRDPRLKIGSPIGYTNEELQSSARRQQCEIILLTAAQGFSKSNMPGFEYASNSFKEQLKILNQVCKKFEVIDVDGNHHTHLNTPEHVAPHIVKFLDGHDS